MKKSLLSFRETKAFTRDVSSLLSEESYFELQRFLHEHFELGDVIPGGGGLRKIRWRLAGKGKSGGVRIIYYFASEKGYIYLLAIYGKNQQANLDKDQLKRLSNQVREWLQ
jgi:mRNA-degrading endonuclease RelE of RelBE toxin-antitoxin system